MRACFHACFHGRRWSAIEALIQGIYRFIKKCKKSLPAVPALSAAVSCMPHAFSENPGEARLYARPARGRKERDEGVKNDRLDPGGSSAREKQFCHAVKIRKAATHIKNLFMFWR